jgi:hypothetical protein
MPLEVRGFAAKDAGFLKINAGIRKAQHIDVPRRRIGLGARFVFAHFQPLLLHTNQSMSGCGCDCAQTRRQFHLRIGRPNFGIGPLEEQVHGLLGPGCFQLFAFVWILTDLGQAGGRQTLRMGSTFL